MKMHLRTLVSTLESDLSSSVCTDIAINVLNCYLPVFGLVIPHNVSIMFDSGNATVQAISLLTHKSRKHSEECWQEMDRQNIMGIWKHI